MGVPEQLRRLDEDLATGRVDAETYRRRRDELLAARLPAPPVSRDDLDDSELDAADRELGLEDDTGTRTADETVSAGESVSAGHGAPTGTRDPALSPAGAPPPGAPAAPPSLRLPLADDLAEDPAEDRDDGARTDERPRPAGPFPPPFRWSTRAGRSIREDGVASDATQVVRNTMGPPADHTQVVRRGAAEPSQTRVVGRPPSVRGSRPGRPAPAPPERTQFVPGAVVARSAGVARPQDTAPPWAAGAAARSEGLQGRELFARGPGPRLGAILGTTAVVLLVLIVLVASFALA